MNFDDLQKAWKSQDQAARLTIDTDVLLKEVRRNHRQFRAMVWWRDVREVGVGLALVAVFAYQGLRGHNWIFFLLAAGCLIVSAFLIVERLLQRRRQIAANDSVKACALGSLQQVNHQIWLLKNVLWWYLMPIALPMAILMGYTIWSVRRFGWSSVIGWVVCTLVIALLYWGIYQLNQFAVRKELEPRRVELEALLVNLP